MFLDKFEQRLCVQDKENGPQDWALGNAQTEESFVWSEAINCNYLSSVWKIWSEPRQIWVTDTKSMFESVKKNVMVYGIECRRQIKQCQKADLTIVQGSQEVIDYFQKCSFCAVVRSICWLEGAEEFVWNKVIV